jgi:ABC-2 type transport system ATP-binding protein
MAEPAVEVAGLEKRYGATAAVAGISLIIERGTVTAVLGPNGAGKTTTLEICEGYRRPDAGRVRVLGLDPIAEAKELRPRIGVMLQDGGGYPGARPMEMLRLIAAFHAHPLDPEMLVDRLGLGPALRTPYRRLSGGQRQRLGLALAIVGRPELVFLDEPTAGLDPQARRATWELVRQLRTDGVTVVLTTHHMDEAERLSDWIVILHHGRVVAEGTPDELTAGDAEDVVRFRGPSSLDLTTLRSALAEGCVAIESPPGTYRIEGVIDPQVLATVTAWCAQHGFLASGLAVQRRTLEDVYLDLTGRDLR